MKNELISKFKERLEKIKKEIEKKIKIFSRVPEMGDDSDSDTESHETQEYDNQLSRAQSLKSRLLEINDSLLKMGKKKYGFCEKCGKEISADLLELVPESKYCKDCKKLKKLRQ